MLNPANKSVSGTTYQASDILTTSVIGQKGTINLRNEVCLYTYILPDQKYWNSIKYVYGVSDTCVRAT